MALGEVLAAQGELQRAEKRLEEKDALQAILDAEFSAVDDFFYQIRLVASSGEALGCMTLSLPEGYPEVEPPIPSVLPKLDASLTSERASEESAAASFVDAAPSSPTRSPT